MRRLLTCDAHEFSDSSWIHNTLSGRRFDRGSCHTYERMVSLRLSIIYIDATYQMDDNRAAKRSLRTSFLAGLSITTTFLSFGVGL